MKGTLINSFVTIPEPKIIKNEVKCVGKEVKSAISLDLRSNTDLKGSSTEIKEFTKIIDKVLLETKPKNEVMPTVLPISKS